MVSTEDLLVGCVWCDREREVIVEMSVVRVHVQVAWVAACVLGGGWRWW